MTVVDLDQLAYGAAWAEQERLHAEVVAGGEEAIILVEHPPVITMGRRGETLGVTNLLASSQVLKDRGVEFVQTDRGGDITFHGPGQLVVYPIIRMIDHKLSVGGYVRTLQEAVIATLRQFGIESKTDAAGVGVWVDEGNEQRATSNESKSSRRGDSLLVARNSSLSKIAAFGVRVKRGVTMHGLALNVTTDLSYFDLIVPCGIADRRVTSMRQVLGDRCPTIDQVKKSIVLTLLKSLSPKSV